MTNFSTKLEQSWSRQNSLLCVGLDPDPARLSDTLRRCNQPIFEFNKAIIDATAQFVCCFKPQIAYYAAQGAETQLENTISYIKSNYPDILVLLDAKRGDIGSTATMYAVEAFERYDADAVTVNPYMGSDTLEPFLGYVDRGVIVLCRTSNSGGSDIQQLVSDHKAIYQHVAQLAVSQWNSNGNVSLVVGATYPEVIAEVRQIVGEMPLLVPGIGAQGGDLEQVLQHGLTVDKKGLIINVSRSVLYASVGQDFAQAAQQEAGKICNQINNIRLGV